jgi:hypothetical protein
MLSFAQRAAKRVRDREYQRKRRAAIKAMKAIVNKATPVAKKIAAPNVTPTPQLTNHIALLVDKSGSMSHLSNVVVEKLNEQIYNIRKESHASGQRTFVSVYTFSRRGDLNRLVVNQHPEAVRTFARYDYVPGGQTALIDAITEVTTDLKREDTGDPNKSFLLITLTDGEENDSRVSRGHLAEEIKRLTGTDRWTFVAVMPPGGRPYAESLGIPSGNIREWEGTVRGFVEATAYNLVGTQNYFSSRAAGQTSTKAFYTDLSNVKPTDLKKLDDLSGDFKRWQVRAETQISDFVEDHGKNYEIGKAFYQLTKPEKIQSHKGIVIEDRSNKALYGGDQARQLLGVTSGPGVTVKVKPGNHANYNVFVQSTSMNRKLVRGTTLLYKQ